MFRAILVTTLASLLWFVSASTGLAGIVAVNRFDMVAENVQRFDTNGSQSASFQSAGLNFFQSLDFDSTTGNLYGLHVGSGGILRVASWAANGSLLSDVSLGIADSTDNGADISVQNGIIAVHRFDGQAEAVLRFNTSGGQLSSFQSAGLNFFQSLDFDSTTGNLYGLHVGSGGVLRVASWGTNGALLSDISLGIADSVDNGEDITVHNGIMAVHRFDGQAEAVLRFNTSGGQLSSFQTAGLNLFQSLDFDSTTGNLYGLHVGSGNILRLATWDANGVLLSDVSLGIVDFVDNGEDLAVLNPTQNSVPEPSMIVIWSVVSVAGAGVYQWRSRRNSARCPQPQIE